MGKRKAGDDEPPPRAPGAAPSAAAVHSPPQRYAALLREVGALNASFAAHVAAHSHSNVALDDAAKAYMRYSAELREKYRDVLQQPAPPPAAARRRGGTLYMVGSGDFGQLGMGKPCVQKSFSPLTTFLPGAPKLLSPFAGETSFHPFKYLSPV
jgi:hypothetical protein